MSIDVRKLKLDHGLEDPDLYYMMFLANGKNLLPCALMHPVKYKDVFDMLLAKFGEAIRDIKIDVSGKILNEDNFDDEVDAVEPAVIQLFR
jgi:hypothetical protein